MLRFENGQKPHEQADVTDVTDRDSRIGRRRPPSVKIVATSTVSRCAITSQAGGPRSAAAGRRMPLRPRRTDAAGLRRRVAGFSAVGRRVGGREDAAQRPQTGCRHERAPPPSDPTSPLPPGRSHLRSDLEVPIRYTSRRRRSPIRSRSRLRPGEAGQGLCICFPLGIRPSQTNMGRPGEGVGLFGLFKPFPWLLRCQKGLTGFVCKTQNPR